VPNPQVNLYATNPFAKAVEVTTRVEAFFNAGGAVIGVIMFSLLDSDHAFL
jgi:antirestriction protein ArdC